MAFTLLFAQAATAQVLHGDFTVTNLNGGPIVPGAIVTVEFNRNPYGVLVSTVYVDLRDGRGPQHSEGEDAVFYPTDPFGLGYRWINNRGVSGTTRFNFASGQWESKVESGPNAGHQSALRR